VLRILHENADLARRTVVNLSADLPPRRSCPCASALRDAIITDRALIPSSVRADLDLLIGKYLEDA